MISGMTAQETTINVHILHGDDAFSLNRSVKELLAAAGDPAEVEMNTTRLDGKTASFEDIQNAAATLPFFGGARWIIVDAALAKVDKGKSDRFVKLLDGLPPTNHLVLVIDDHPRWRKDANGKWMQVWETLNETHWLTKWSATHHEIALVQAFALPDERAMDAWITSEVKRQGGKIEPEAAHEMTAHVGNETSIASQEIAKLLMYVNYERPISVKDVIELVSSEGSADVFVMLDAMMAGKTREAQGFMHRLLEEQPPEVILGAISHRFRQLIQVREALDAREDLRVLVERKVIFNNQVNKYTTEARRFKMEELEAIYRRLLEIDLKAKTTFGEMDTDLETLVVEINSNN
jgi:DNA polymerase-3 subunit delta